MKICLILIASLAFSLSIASNYAPFAATTATIIEGKVTGNEGLAIPGADIRILDAQGNFRGQAVSDMDGLYRSPAISVAEREERDLVLEVTHIRFQPVRQPVGIESASPRFAFLAQSISPFVPIGSSKAVRRDITLTGGPTFPNSANPQSAEVLYREALLNLNENRKKALEQLELYARTGANMRQVGRALLLISEYRSKLAYGDLK